MATYTGIGSALGSIARTVNITRTAATAMQAFFVRGGQLFKLTLAASVSVFATLRTNAAAILRQSAGYVTALEPRQWVTRLIKRYWDTRK